MELGAEGEGEAFLPFAAESASAPAVAPVVAEPLVRACRRCQQSIALASRFCPQCGVDQQPHLAAAALRQEARRERLSWRAVKRLLIFYVLYLGTIMPLVWLPETNKADGLLVVSVVDAVVISLYWLWTRSPLGAALRPNRRSLAAAVLGVAALAILLPLNLLYHHLLLSFFGIHPQDLDGIAKPFINGGYGLAVQLFSIALMPAIWEEIAFRGLIQGQLGTVVSIREAVVLTAVLFAIIHLTWLSMPYLFLLGLVLGVLRQRSNSLLPGMMVHGLHNAAVLLWERYGL